MVSVRRQQNLAEHSYAVALIAGKLSEMLPERLTDREESDMIKLALLHDMPEIEYGDIPSPTKKKLEEIGMGDVYSVLEAHFWNDRGAKTTPEFHASMRVRYLVRLADLIEAAIFYNNEGPDERIKQKIKFDAADYAYKHFPGNEKINSLIEEVL